MRTGFLLATFLTLIAISLPAAAQDAGSMEDRLALARQMHEIRPMNVQIEQAIRQLALRYPEDKREKFITTMLETFDKETLTEISVKAMAETFTVGELQKMVDFHGSPEGEAITRKMPVYQAIVEPEIVRKIDKALMEVRTGAAGSQP